MHTHPFSSTDNEDNNFLDESNANEYEPLVSEVTSAKRRGKKVRLVIYTHR
jgi:hypothetical protein